MKKTFIASHHQALLASYQLDNFESLWAREIAWFEEPNQRRGGWSGVGRLELNQSGLANINVFVKKQQNHGRRTLLHPIKGEPTFRREFERLQFLASHQFSAPKVVFYAESEVAGCQRAILVTEALDDYQPLDLLMNTWRDKLSSQQQSLLIQKLATELRRFHQLGLVHRALYPKHIFVKNAAHEPDIALIDLEKARFTPCFLYRAFFDLAALNRHVEGARLTQKLAFFMHYFGLINPPVKRLSAFHQWICRCIVKRSQR
ncbi:MAG: lipopolysaccharide kinase InaA family protein [Methylotenera sp.]|nr:lipopolysaccharide kinase InaA family protein [Methylotenera sp.]